MSAGNSILGFPKITKMIDLNHGFIHPHGKDGSNGLPDQA